MISGFPRRLAAPLLLFCVSGLWCAQAQEATAPPPPSETTTDTPASGEKAPKAQFFAGTVTTLEHDSLTVSRTLVGKAPESRTFLINARTKLAKGLKSKLRVTVRYQHHPEGDIALEVQIRQSRFPRPS